MSKIKRKIRKIRDTKAMKTIFKSQNSNVHYIVLKVRADATFLFAGTRLHCNGRILKLAHLTENFSGK